MPVVPSHHYREIYTEADLERLANRHDIPANLRDEFARMVEDAAAIWRRYRAAEEERVPPSQAAKALQDLSKLAGKLHAALSNLPAKAEISLANEIDGATGQFLQQGDDLEGLPVLMVPKEDGTLEPVFVEASEYLHLLGALQSMATDAAQFPAGRKGAKRDHALRMWMANVEPFWSQTLGRPFTRDTLNSGAPLSPAARFCADLFAFVDPETPTTRVMHEMKVRIVANRRRATGKNSAKNEG